MGNVKAIQLFAFIILFASRFGWVRLKQQRGCHVWYRSNDSGGNQMGALRRRTGDEVESGRAHDDALN